METRNGTDESRNCKTGVDFGTPPKKPSRLSDALLQYPCPLKTDSLNLRWTPKCGTKKWPYEAEKSFWQTRIKDRFQNGRDVRIFYRQMIKFSRWRNCRLYIASLTVRDKVVPLHYTLHWSNTCSILHLIHTAFVELALFPFSGGWRIGWPTKSVIKNVLSSIQTVIISIKN